VTISAWLLTLADSETPIPEALRTDPRVTLGERSGQRLAVVIATDDPDGTLAAGEVLRDLEGVAQGALVCVLDEEAVACTPAVSDGRNR
jgi:hypothetical protein